MPQVSGETRASLHLLELADLGALFNRDLDPPIRQLFLEMPLVRRWVRGFEQDFYLWMALGWRYRHVHLYELNKLRPYQLCGRLFYHFALNQVGSQNSEHHLIMYFFCIRNLADLNLMSLLLDRNAGNGRLGSLLLAEGALGEC